jgi:hypothetical protein
MRFGMDETLERERWWEGTEETRRWWKSGLVGEVEVGVGLEGLGGGRRGSHAGDSGGVGGLLTYVKGEGPSLKSNGVAVG